MPAADNHKDPIAGVSKTDAARPSLRAAASTNIHQSSDDDNQLSTAGGAAFLPSNGFATAGSTFSHCSPPTSTTNALSPVMTIDRQYVPNNNKEDDAKNNIVELPSASDSDSEVDFHIDATGSSVLLTKALPPMAPPSSAIPQHEAATGNNASHSSQFLDSESQSYVATRLSGSYGAAVARKSGGGSNVVGIVGGDVVKGSSTVEGVNGGNGGLVMHNSPGGILLAQQHPLHHAAPPFRSAAVGGIGAMTNANRSASGGSFRVDASASPHPFVSNNSIMSGITTSHQNVVSSASGGGGGGAAPSSGHHSASMHVASGSRGMTSYSHAAAAGSGDSHSSSLNGRFATKPATAPGLTTFIPNRLAAPYHQMYYPHQQQQLNGSYVSEPLASNSFTGSLDATVGSSHMGVQTCVPQQQHHQQQQWFPTPNSAFSTIVSPPSTMFQSPAVGSTHSVMATPNNEDTFMISTNHNSPQQLQQRERSGSFDGDIGQLLQYQELQQQQQQLYQQQRAMLEPTNNNNNSSPASIPSMYLGSNNNTTDSSIRNFFGHNTTPTTHSTPNSVLQMMSGHGVSGTMISSQSPGIHFGSSGASQQQQQRHRQHMSSSVPMSSDRGPGVISPANAMTNSSCVSGDIPINGGAGLPSYETTGLPMDAFEMAMLREQYLHGTFHQPAVDPNDTAVKKKRRRRKRKKDDFENGSGDDEPQRDGDEGGGDKDHNKHSAIKSKSRVMMVPGLPVHLPLVGKVGFIPYTTIMRQYSTLMAKKKKLLHQQPSSDNNATADLGGGATSFSSPFLIGDPVQAVDIAISTAETDAAAAAAEGSQIGSTDAQGGDDVVSVLSHELGGGNAGGMGMGSDDDDILPSYDVIIATPQLDDDTNATSSAPPPPPAPTSATTQARLFIGQVPYSIELNLIQAIFFVIGGGCEVDHVERIVKWKNRELPSGCLHVHINVEYQLADHPEGSHTDPTDSSMVVSHALKLDQVVLLDDEGVWVPTSNRKAFSIVDTHVDAFERFLVEQSEINAMEETEVKNEAAIIAAQQSLLLAAKTEVSPGDDSSQALPTTATTNEKSVEDQNSVREHQEGVPPTSSEVGAPDQQPAQDREESAVVAAATGEEEYKEGCQQPRGPPTMGSFGMTFGEFKAFLKSCASETQSLMPGYAMAWCNEGENTEAEEEMDGNDSVGSHTVVSHLPPVPIIHPDIAAINLHGRGQKPHHSATTASAAPTATAAAAALPIGGDTPPDPAIDAVLATLDDAEEAVDVATTSITTSAAPTVVGPTLAPAPPVACPDAPHTVCKHLLNIPVDGFRNTPVSFTRPLTFTTTHRTEQIAIMGVLEREESGSVVSQNGGGGNAVCGQEATTTCGNNKIGQTSSVDLSHEEPTIEEPTAAATGVVMEEAVPTSPSVPLSGTEAPEDGSSPTPSCSIAPVTTTGTTPIIAQSHPSCLSSERDATTVAASTSTTQQYAIRGTRPPLGPDNPDFVVPSLQDQREALVSYVAYLKDAEHMVCRPIDRPYQLMSVQRARSTFVSPPKTTVTSAMAPATQHHQVVSNNKDDSSGRKKAPLDPSAMADGVQGHSQHHHHHAAGHNHHGGGRQPRGGGGGPHPPPPTTAPNNSNNRFSQQQPFMAHPHHFQHQQMMGGMMYPPPNANNFPMQAPYHHQLGMYSNNNSGPAAAANASSAMGGTMMMMNGQQYVQQQQQQYFPQSQLPPQQQGGMMMMMSQQQQYGGDQSVKYQRQHQQRGGHKAAAADSNSQQQVSSNNSNKPNHSSRPNASASSFQPNPSAPAWNHAGGTAAATNSNGQQ